METVEDILAHYGVKGMKWGVRRAAPAIPASDDARKAEAARSKIKTGGVKAVSNAELQGLITRMNLEQQYKRMNPSMKRQAAKFVTDTLIGIGKQEASKFAMTFAAKQMAGLLKRK